MAQPSAELRWRSWVKGPLLIPSSRVFLRSKGLLMQAPRSLSSSFAEENEHLAERVLDEFPQMRLSNQKFCLPFRDHFGGAFAARLVNTG
jgi:hypothetical protein